MRIWFSHADERDSLSETQAPIGEDGEDGEDEEDEDNRDNSRSDDTVDSIQRQD